MPTNPELTAKMVFDHAFRPESGREAKSNPYMEGVMALLQYRMDESTALGCPYAIGTAECDAWLSGTDEGRLLARERHNYFRVGA